MYAAALIQENYRGLSTASEEEYCKCDEKKLNCKPCYYLQENIIHVAGENGKLKMNSEIKGGDFMS